MGRDVGRDEGREQAEWRDLVARLELQAPIDPADAPWPDRENLRAKPQPATAGSPSPDAVTGSAESNAGPDETAAAGPGNTGQDEAGEDGTGGQARRGPADRSRVIRPAGLTRFGGPDGEHADGEHADGEPGEPADVETTDVEPAGASAGAPGDPGEPARPADPAGRVGPDVAVPGGPRDYELDEPRDDDLDDWDDRYVPPPLPPQPGLDPVAKGAWLALFGGPGYLLVATLLNWQIAGWAALTAVVAFITGFVVLVFRLGDGPSKRDGPDQGAVV